MQITHRKLCSIFVRIAVFERTGDRCANPAAHVIVHKLSGGTDHIYPAVGVWSASRVIAVSYRDLFLCLLSPAGNEMQQKRQFATDLGLKGTAVATQFQLFIVLYPQSKRTFISHLTGRARSLIVKTCWSVCAPLYLVIARHNQNQNHLMTSGASHYVLETSAGPIPGEREKLSLRQLILSF